MPIRWWVACFQHPTATSAARTSRSSRKCLNRNVWIISAQLLSAGWWRLKKAVKNKKTDSCCGRLWIRAWACFYFEEENNRTASTKYPFIKVMCSLTVCMEGLNKKDARGLCWCLQIEPHITWPSRYDPDDNLRYIQHIRCYPVSDKEQGTIFQYTSCDIC